MGFSDHKTANHSPLDLTDLTPIERVAYLKKTGLRLYQKLRKKDKAHLLHYSEEPDSLHAKATLHHK